MEKTETDAFNKLQKDVNILKEIVAAQAQEIESLNRRMSEHKHHTMATIGGM